MKVDIYDYKTTTTTKLFKELSYKDVRCQHCYYLWKDKHLTLEQSLVLAINLVREHCNKLIGFVPVKECGVLFEYLYYIDALEAGELIWKLKYLVDCLIKLFDIAIYYLDRRPIIIHIPKEV